MLQIIYGLILDIFLIGYIVINYKKKSLLPLVAILGLNISTQATTHPFERFATHIVRFWG